MQHKKASMNLEDALSSNSKKNNTEVTEKKSVNDSLSKNNLQKKRAVVPFYVPSNLHDAMQSICFIERRNKMNMQKMIIEGLELLFEKKGYPSVDAIIKGDKNIKI